MTHEQIKKKTGNELITNENKKQMFVNAKDAMENNKVSITFKDLDLYKLLDTFTTSNLIKDLNKLLNDKKFENELKEIETVISILRGAGIKDNNSILIKNKNLEFIAEKIGKFSEAVTKLQEKEELQNSNFIENLTLIKKILEQADYE